MADNRRYVYQALRRELGLTPAQAAGAVGGLGGESGRSLDPNAVNRSTGALGIGQWLGGRAHGVRKGDLRSQTQHLIAELKGPERGALNRLRGTHSINDATRAWVEGFERPSAAEISSSMPARLGYARDAFNAFRGVGGGSGGGGGGGGASGSTVTQQTASQGTLDQGQAQSLLPLIQALTGAQAQPRSTAGVAPPAFSAQAPMPQGYQSAPSGGGPAPGPDIGKLADAIKTLGGDVPQTQVQDGLPGDTPSTAVASGSEAVPRMSGKVQFAATADRPGAKTQPITREFLDRVSGLAMRELTVGTGTNHNRMTTSGNVSDHWTGHAADLPQAVDSKTGDLVAAHALQAAGVPWSQAIQMAKKGGVFNVTPERGEFKGRRVQVLWKTMVGGNHHNHVHIGIR